MKSNSRITIPVMESLIRIAKFHHIRAGAFRAAMPMRMRRRRPVPGVVPLRVPIGIAVDG